MLDIKLYRENPEVIKNDLKKRNWEEKISQVDEVVSKDKEHRELQTEIQKLRNRKNVLSAEINELKKQKKDASKELKEAKELPVQIKEIEEKQEKLAADIKNLRMRIPNILHESVPEGKDGTENTVIRKWGKIHEPKFELKNHAEIIELLEGGDFKKAAEVCGAGFYYLFGDFALLDQALQQFAIQHIIKRGFTLVEPPFMLKREAYEGVTDLSDFENVMYKVEGEDLFLIATSEHPIGALLMNETVDEEKLPLKLAGISACFRREIGSHGVDTKGLFRVHQFNKIEQFIFCRPEDSWKHHEEILKNAEELFQALEIPYQVVSICTGDIGIVAAKKYDIEAWMPREKMYREVVSCSNCTGYQAVRLNIKYKKGAEKEYMHTLNSTAIATGRAMRAIIELNQNEDGTVDIPKVLQPYMGGKKKIEFPKRI